MPARPRLLLVVPQAADDGEADQAARGFGQAAHGFGAGNLLATGVAAHGRDRDAGASGKFREGEPFPAKVI